MDAKAEKVEKTVEESLKQVQLLQTAKEIFILLNDSTSEAVGMKVFIFHFCAS